MRVAFPFEVKSVGSSMEITGIGSVFGNVDLGGDVVMPGAFHRTIKAHEDRGSMPAMLWQHNSDQPIGAWRSMRETSEGLVMEGEFADTTLGRDVKTLAAMKAISGLSIGFAIKDAEFDHDGNRLLKEVDLWETSVVTFPMNPEAVIQTVKSHWTKRECETNLRDVGYSQRAAKAVVSTLFKDTGTVPASDGRDGQMDDDEILAEQLRKMREASEERLTAIQLRRRFM